MAADRPPAAGRGRFQKTCFRCGRTGSHAFRATPDGLFECTTATACRARVRHQKGALPGGRGRLPRNRDSDSSSGLPGVAYVIGEPGEERDEVAATVRELTGLHVVEAQPNRRTLAALSAHNTKLLCIAAACLITLGFRSELELRRRQARLGTVPIVVFGGSADDFQDLATVAGPVSTYSADMLR
ncbi:MAG TPA: hypothetical protein VFK61_08255 [Candidatus Limnocylindria bacterium]|nr:hypothetical protein [Candidatus Limnocylindria bacterium]